MPELTDARRLEILRHMLGWPKPEYRDHFVAYRDTPDCVALERMETEGLVTRRRPKPGFLDEKSIVFYVTATGRRFVSDRNPPPPSEGRRRYLRWLDVSDSYPMPFGEFLRRKLYTDDGVRQFLGGA